MNKFFLAVAVVLALVFVPKMSISKDNNSDTVVLTKNNVLVLNSEVNGESTSEVISRAKELDSSMSSVKESYSKKKPLYLFLNTPGGSVQAGLEMIEAQGVLVAQLTPLLFSLQAWDFRLPKIWTIV